jgi:hypothetical protein
VKSSLTTLLTPLLLQTLPGFLTHLLSVRGRIILLFHHLFRGRKLLQFFNRLPIYHLHPLSLNILVYKLTNPLPILLFILVGTINIPTILDSNNVILPTLLPYPLTRILPRLPLMSPYTTPSFQSRIPIQKSSTDLSFLEHFACAAKTNPDVLHYGSMLKDPDRSSFESDMQREVSDLLRTETVKITPCSIVPSGLKILQAIWSFLRKWAPNWSIIKHKSCLCPHGGQQIEGEHFWETYSPFVNLRTVCLVLILSLLSNLQSRQVDYVNAFNQAPADCDIFINIPPGLIVENNTLIFSHSSTKNISKDYVHGIKKNMYGL